MSDTQTTEEWLRDNNNGLLPGDTIRIYRGGIVVAEYTAPVKNIMFSIKLLDAQPAGAQPDAVDGKSKRCSQCYELESWVGEIGDSGKCSGCTPGRSGMCANPKLDADDGNESGGE